jgi:hypothetical protein
MQDEVFKFAFNKGVTRQRGLGVKVFFCFSQTLDERLFKILLAFDSVNGNPGNYLYVLGNSNLPRLLSLFSNRRAFESLNAGID